MSCRAWRSQGAGAETKSLRDLFFFFFYEGLTDLGKLMAFLPVEPRIAKMIIFGAIFR